MPLDFTNGYLEFNQSHYSYNHLKTLILLRIWLRVAHLY